MKPLLVAGLLLLFALPPAPAAAQERIFFPAAEEFRHAGTAFAERVYDCDLVVPLDDTATVRLIRPSGLAFVDDRTLVLLDSAAGTIHRFTLPDLRFDGPFGGEGIFAGQFRTPHSIVPFEQGFAVSDAGNQRVQLLDRSFAPVETFGRMGDTGERDGFARPAGLAVGGKRLYICDLYNHEVKVFGLETRQGRSPFGQERFAPARSLRHPAACDAFRDELAVADYGKDRVVFFSIERKNPGRFLRAVGADSSHPRHLSGPVALAHDRRGNLWVADRGNRRVVKMEAPIEAGTIAVELTGTTAGVRLVSPAAVAVNALGEVAVLDDELKQVILYRPDHFAKGRAAYRSGDMNEALRRFALDRATGRRIGAENVYAVFYSAQCHEAAGRFAEAVAEYEHLVGRFGYGVVRRQAEFRLKALRPLLPPPEREGKR